MKAWTIAALLMLAACGGDSGLSTGTPPSAPSSADLAGLWEGEWNGVAFVMFVRESGDAYGYFEDDTLYSVRGTVQPLAEQDVKLSVCRHAPSIEWDGGWRQPSSRGACGLQQVLQFSAIEGQSIVASNEDILLSVFPAERPVELPAEGCAARKWRHDYVDGSDPWGYPLYSSGMFTLALSADGSYNATIEDHAHWNSPDSRYHASSSTGAVGAVLRGGVRELGENSFAWKHGDRMAMWSVDGVSSHSLRILGPMTECPPE